MFFFFDTSALVKRYHIEEGTILVNKIFDNSSNIIVISSISLVEVVSALNKIKNRREITVEDLNIALSQFFTDCRQGRIGVIDIKRSHILSSPELILEHNLDSSDAIILSCILPFQRFNPTFVCADIQSNLIRAAQRVGLSVFNPLDSPQQTGENT